MYNVHTKLFGSSKKENGEHKEERYRLISKTVCRLLFVCVCYFLFLFFLFCFLLFVGLGDLFSSCTHRSGRYAGMNNAVSNDSSLFFSTFGAINTCKNCSNVSIRNYFGSINFAVIQFEDPHNQYNDKKILSG